MDDLLRELLNQLERIAGRHEEIFDTECRDRMSRAIMEAFVRDDPDFVLPDDFGLDVPTANREVGESLANFIARAVPLATESGIHRFHDRLAVFQDEDVESQGGNYFDDFFGYSSPEEFDADGNVVN